MTAGDAGARDEGAAAREVVGVARGGGANVLGAVFTQLARFAITLLLARVLGGAEAGRFFEAYAVLMMLTLVSTGGFGLSLTRFVAVHRADGDDAATRGAVRIGLTGTVLLSTVLAVGLFALAPAIAEGVFDDAGTATLLRWMAAALPVTAFTDVALSATQGFRTMRAYAGITLVFEPATRLALTGALIAAGAGVEGATIAIVATNTAAAALAAIALRRLLGRRTGPVRYDVRGFLAFSSAGWLSNLASNWLLWADTILIGAFATSRDVAVYQVATRLALLTAVAVGPLATSFAPRAADLYRRGATETLERAFVAVTSWMLRLYLPAFAIVVVFRREILALFGPGFVAGTTVMLVLALAQLANTATGPCGYLITMSGRIGVQLALNAAALVCNVALNLWLIPAYGIEGAAISWASVIVTFNALKVTYVRRTLGLSPFDPRGLKIAVGGAAAIAVAFACRVAVDGPVGLALAIPLVTVTSIAVAGAFGLAPDDRLVLATLRRRFRLRSA